MVKSKTVTESKDKAVNAVQLWHGPNLSLLEVEAAHWRSEFRKRHPQAVLVRLEYEADTADELTRALQQAIFGGGLFSEKKLVELSNFLSTDSKSGLADIMLSLSENLPSGVFVIMLEPDKIIWSKALPAAFKKLINNGKITAREFNDLSVPELEKWIAGQIHIHGGQASPLAVRQLALGVGNDFLKLTQEIAKLVAYCDKQAIKPEDVNLLVEVEIKDSSFAMLDAVGKRDLVAAMAVLTRQFRQGTSPQQLVGMLAWHLRTLMSVRQAIDSSNRKLSARELADQLGLNSFVVNRALQQIPYYSAKKLSWLYNELSNLDIKLKTSQVEPEARFGLFLSKLATLSIKLD